LKKWSTWLAFAKHSAVAGCIVALCLLFSTPPVYSQTLTTPTTRLVKFELEEVDEATAYEIEIQRTNGLQVGLYKIGKTLWSGQLSPGKYRMRSRTYDVRGVPGIWGDFEEFTVRSLAPQLLGPIDDSEAPLKADGKVTLNWEASAGAVKYQLNLERTRGPSGDFPVSLSQTVNGTSFATLLPGGSYSWSVTAIMADGQLGEKPKATAQFKSAGDPSANVGPIAREWKTDTKATGYEIEIATPEGTLIGIFPAALGAWSGWLKAGDYVQRIRPLDSQGKPGEWSRAESFNVLPLAPRPLSPGHELEIISKDEDEAKVDFEWAPSAGALRYRVEIENVDSQGQASPGGVRISETVNGTSRKITLPVALAYRWRVVPLLADDLAGEPSQAPAQFVVHGRELAPPEIQDPDTVYVTSLAWTADRSSKTHSYKIERYQSKTKKWTVLEEKAGIAESTIPFAKKYPGGRYRLTVSSADKYGRSSKPSTFEFRAHSGDRTSPEAYAGRLRESVERRTSYYFVASYLVTGMDYVGQDKETNSTIMLNVFGGTGRLGLGYHKPESKIGYFGVADLGGFLIDGRNYTFASSDAHLVWREARGPWFFRGSMGVSYKELVELKGTLGTLDGSTVGKIATLGPHIGFDLERAITPIYGLQLNARVYRSQLGLQTPNGQALVPTFSYQFGAMGRLKLRKNVVGFMGYAYRRDSAAYLSTPDDGTPPITSIAQPGDLQTIDITGHYLNLLLEWGF
jgi:hypothetical protein